MVRVPSLDFNITEQKLTPSVKEPNVFDVAQDIAGEYAKVQLEVEKKDANTWAIQAENDLRFKSLEAIEKAKNEAKTPDEIGERFFSQLENYKSEIAKTAPNKLAQDSFAQIYEGVRGQMGASAVRAELEEKQKLRIQRVDSAISEKINYIRNGGSFSDTMQLIENDINNANDALSLSEFGKLSAEYKQEAKVAYLDKLTEDGNYSNIRSLINDNSFNKDLSSQQVDAYRGVIQKLKKQELEKQSVYDAINFKGFIDPKSKDDKKAIDLVFDKDFSQSFFSGDIDAYKRTIEMTANTGVVPSTIKSYINASYVNPSFESKALAYKYISDVEKTNPNSLSFANIKQNIIDEANYYTSLKEQGVPEEDAYNIVQANFNSRDKNIIEFRKEDLKPKGLAHKSIDEISLGDVVGNWFFEPDVIDVTGKERAYKASYKTIYDGYYLQTGDANFAEEQAKKIFAQNHGMSRVTSDSEYLTDLAPEYYYKHAAFVDDFEGESNTYLWLRRQLTESLSQYLDKPNVNHEDYRLVADYISQKEVANGDMPSYAIFEKTEENGLQYVKRIRFDIQKALKENKDLYIQNYNSSKRTGEVLLDAINAASELNPLR